MPFLIFTQFLDTHIMKHHGPTNKKLRLHLPLVGVEGSRMRVGNETRNLKAGKVTDTMKNETKI